ncbi:MAG: maleylpyruvate isomerase N-terminal domain-containing protein [Chloroflexota bacterium]
MDSKITNRDNAILVNHLFAETLNALIDLLRSLNHEEWNAPTACEGWSVKDVALHLLGDDMGRLSWGRDGFSAGFTQTSDWQELVAFINQQNELWVRATQRISTRLLCDLLESLGQQVTTYFESLELFASGSPVNWAGAEPAPIWLDVAREYTERWHHQQHIRDAVNNPGLTEPRYLNPVLQTFAYSLPVAAQSILPSEATLLSVEVTGAAANQWFLVYGEESWRLAQACQDTAQATLVMDDDTAWRFFTKGLSPEETEQRIRINGDVQLGRKLLGAVAILA